MLNAIDFSRGLNNIQPLNQTLQGNLAKELVNICNTSTHALKENTFIEHASHEKMPNPTLKASNELVLELKNEAMRDVPKDIKSKIETMASYDVKEKIYEFMILVKQVKDYTHNQDIDALAKLGLVERDFLSLVKNHRLDDKSPLGRDESVRGADKFKRIKSALFQMLPKDDFALGNQIIKNKIEPLIFDYEKKNPQLAVSLRETIELVQGQRRVNADGANVSADPLLNKVLDLKLVSKMLDLVQKKIAEWPDLTAGGKNLKDIPPLPVQHMTPEEPSVPKVQVPHSGPAHYVNHVGGAVTHVNVDLSALKESFDGMNKTTEGVLKLIGFLIQELGSRGGSDQVDMSGSRDLSNNGKDFDLKRSPVDIRSDMGEKRNNETLSTAIKRASVYPATYEKTQPTAAISTGNLLPHPLEKIVKPEQNAMRRDNDKTENLSQVSYTRETMPFGNFEKLSNMQFMGNKLAGTPPQPQSKTEKSLQSASDNNAHDAKNLSPVSRAREMRLFGEFAKPAELREIDNKLKNISLRSSQEATKKPSPEPISEEIIGAKSSSANYYIGSQGSAQAPSAFSVPRNFSSPQQWLQVETVNNHKK